MLFLFWNLFFEDCYGRYRHTHNVSFFQFKPVLWLQLDVCAVSLLLSALPNRKLFFFPTRSLLWTTEEKKSFPFWMSACSHTDRTHRHTDRQKHCKQKKNAQKTRHLRCWRLFPSPFHWRPKSTFHHHSFILQWITPLPVIEFNHLFNRRWA